MTKPKSKLGGRLLIGDCLERLKELPDSSIDSVVTDPPYELGFMGKSWDASGIAFNVEVWSECLRILKPGGHLLAFSGSRTYHRMAVAIEDAGFEIRDQIQWIYGSGFPKSLDVSKAIDKQRDDSGESSVVAEFLLRFNRFQTVSEYRQHLNLEVVGDAHAGGSAQGWTTVRTDGAVKPRVPTWDQWLQLKALLNFGDDMDAEVWRLNGRKGQPGEAWAEREVVGSKTSGIGTAFGDGEWASGQAQEVDITAPATDEARQWAGWGTALKPAHEPIVVARKPLIGTVAENVLTYGTGGLNIDGGRVEGREITQSRGARETSNTYSKISVASLENAYPAELGRWPANVIHDGSDEVVEFFGEPARFFYCAKASKKDRNAGLDGMPEKRPDERSTTGMGTFEEKGVQPQRNFHPTVKPVALMRYLIRLVTPPNGTVLDPFLGSGTTAVAAVLEGFKWKGCEKTAEYLPIIEGRVKWANKEKRKKK